VDYGAVDQLVAVLGVFVGEDRVQDSFVVETFVM
jgi:hypothetical protein